MLVGDANAFAKQLAGVGFDQFERIAVNDLDLTSPDLRRRGRAVPGGIEPVSYVSYGSPSRGVQAPTAQAPAAPAAPVKESISPAVTSEEVRQLIGRMVNAKGNLSNLRSVRTVRAASTTTVLETPGGRVNIPTTTSIGYPGGFRVDAELPTGKLIQTFNAGQYWVQDDSGAREAPPQLAMAIRSNVQRDIIPLLLGLTDGRILAERVPDEVDGERKLPVLLVAGAGHASRQPGARSRHAGDPQAALRHGQRDDRGALLRLSQRWTAYRWRSRRRFAGTAMPLMERVVRTIEFNVPLDSSLFTKPS